MRNFIFLYRKLGLDYLYHKGELRNLESVPSGVEKKPIGIVAALLGEIVLTDIVESARFGQCPSSHIWRCYAIRVVAAATLFFALAGFQHETAASSGTGLTGRTNKSGGTGCSDCHGAVAETLNLSVTISGPAMLAAGTSSTYTVTAAKTGVANGVRMGIDVAASDTGTPLSAINGQPTVRDVGTGEIIHSTIGGTVALKTIANGLSESYSFTYTMPANAAFGSTHTLYAVAVLGYPGSWRHAANFTVTVPQPPPVNPTGVPIRIFLLD